MSNRLHNEAWCHVAAGVECIDALLRAGADRSIRDVDGKTALDATIDAGRDDCARALNLEISNAKVRLPRLTRNCFLLRSLLEHLDFVGLDL